jgi:LmbE family N-acetylglucosaminyl deacetylase
MRADPIDWLRDPHVAAPPVLLVCAHPDDETASATVALLRSPRAMVVHLTTGVPNDLRFAQAAGFPDRQRYEAARRSESMHAMAAAGVATITLRALGAIDQRAAHAMPRLALAVAALVMTHRPAQVLTHPYEGGHPDHDVAAFVARAALDLLARRKGPAPTLLEFASYHDRAGTMVTGEFLPGSDPGIRVPLTAEERTRKRAMLAAFASQQAILACFSADEERYRLAPHADFGFPPHAGTLLYERWGWELSGADFRRLAARAAAELGVATRPPPAPAR